MSFLSDIIQSCSTKTIRSKLTQNERGELLSDITDSLEWETYETIRDAVNEIKKHDKDNPNV